MISDKHSGSPGSCRSRAPEGDEPRQLMHHWCVLLAGVSEYASRFALVFISLFPFQDSLTIQSNSSLQHILLFLLPGNLQQLQRFIYSFWEKKNVFLWKSVFSLLCFIQFKWLISLFYTIHEVLWRAVCLSGADCIVPGDVFCQCKEPLEETPWFAAW